MLKPKPLAVAVLVALARMQGVRGTLRPAISRHWGLVVA